MSTVGERRHWRRHGRPADKPAPIPTAEQNAWNAATDSTGAVHCQPCGTQLVGFRDRDYSLRTVDGQHVVACGTGPITCSTTSGDPA